ncbi:MAG: protein-L-isoaspartate(D-aspartate) O-methyltransferase [Deltaproteobacteria bacterium]|nr:protein-L-isoaspartate(D-aspartate) O-methyltransferase [Deltaproteobacteria bacterium]
MSSARRSMLDAIRRDVERNVEWGGKPELDPRVMEAIARVPRERFVPDDLRDLAYENEALPIGRDQTISQPYIVAVMTDALALDPDHRVLEVGTGSGYQTAILAELAAAVYTIERIRELSQDAVERLHTLGYRNVFAATGDGSLGWPEQAPFDAIIVTAAASRIPLALLEQLATPGRMVVPVGRIRELQTLHVIAKDEYGEISDRTILPVTFVPLIEG